MEINLKSHVTPELQSLLDELQSMDLEALPDAFKHRLEAILGGGEIPEKLIRIDYETDTTDALNPVVALYPTKTFQVLMSALRTGDVDLLGEVSH